MTEQVPSKELCDCCESRSDRRCCWDEITSLRGQLEAAEQHVKVLRENFAAHKPGCAISSYLRGADRVTCDCGGTAPEPCAGPYCIEPHGDGFALYRGRDQSHHGWNLARITETTPDVLRLIEGALNRDLGASQPPSSEDAARWAFFRKHYMASYRGKWLHVWLVDNVFRADGIDGAIDEVMAECSRPTKEVR